MKGLLLSCSNSFWDLRGHIRNANKKPSSAKMEKSKTQDRIFTILIIIFQGRHVGGIFCAFYYYHLFSYSVYLLVVGGYGCGRKCIGWNCFFCCLKKENGLLPSPETSRSSSLTPLTRFTSTHFLYCYTSVIKMAQFVHPESEWIPFQGKKEAKEHHLHPSVN